MATLIPAISACVSRMTSGERRVAERLEQKLDDDNSPLFDQAFPKVAPLASVHRKGITPENMAALRADWKTMDLRASALAPRKLPHRVRKKSGKFQTGSDVTQVITMKASKGLGLPFLAPTGVSYMPALREDEKRSSSSLLCCGNEGYARLSDGGDQGFDGLQTNTLATRNNH